jgi:hypothetical protein
MKSGKSGGMKCTRKKKQELFIELRVFDFFFLHFGNCTTHRPQTIFFLSSRKIKK